MKTTENKLIAEFMGYKLVKCNDGQAWESPHEKDIDDIFNLHGRLWRENEFYYKWETSWDWLMPVYFQIQNTIAPLMDGTNGEHENSCADMGLAILDDNKEEAIKQAIIAINWYNKQKEPFVSKTNGAKTNGA